MTQALQNAVGPVTLADTSAGMRQVAGQKVADGVLLREGRTSVQSWAAHPAPPDPAAATWLVPTTGSGQVAQDDRARWFARRGFVLEQVELYSVLDLQEDGTLDRARAAAEGARAAYRARTWQGSTPAELRAGMAQLRNRMSTDAPTGGIDYGEESWDEDEVVAHDERQVRDFQNYGRNYLLGARFRFD